MPVITSPSGLLLYVALWAFAVYGILDAAEAVLRG